MSEENEPVGNETDSLARRHVKRAKRLKDLTKRDHITRRTVLTALMGDLEGRRFVWVILSDANVFLSTYVEGSFDATAFREGQRVFGQRLLVDVQRWCPANYIQMTKENASVEIEGEDDE